MQFPKNAYFSFFMKNKDFHEKQRFSHCGRGPAAIVKKIKKSQLTFVSTNNTFFLFSKLKFNPLFVLFCSVLPVFNLTDMFGRLSR